MSTAAPRQTKEFQNERGMDRFRARPVPACEGAVLGSWRTSTFQQRLARHQNRASSLKIPSEPIAGRMP